MVIRKINLNKVEELLKKIISLSFQLKLFQEFHEVVKNQMKINKSVFSSGNISKEIYKKNKTILENERKKLIKKINEIIVKIIRLGEELKKIIENNKI